MRKLLSIILLALVVGIYFYAFSELTNVGLGGIQGSGILSMIHPSTNENVKIQAGWGISTGVFLCMLSLIMFIMTLFLEKNRKDARGKYE